MPFVHIRIASHDITSAHVTHLQTETTRLMATILRKKAELTAVLVEQLEPVGWSVGGEHARVAGHIDVKITAGTNTAEEKSAFIGHANTLLKKVLGTELPVATYVVIHEVAADAWGYDGQTQQARRPSADAARISSGAPVTSSRTGVSEMIMAVFRLVTFQPRSHKSSIMQ